MKNIYLLSTLGILVLTAAVQAQSRIESNCAVMKITRDFTTSPSKPPSFETIATYSYTTALEPMTDTLPGVSWVGIPVRRTLSSPQPPIVSVVLDGTPRELQDGLSVILITPSARTLNRWGICQFRQAAAVQWVGMNNTRFSTQLSSSNFGAQRLVSGRITCEDITIANNRWFATEPTYGVLPDGGELLSTSCSHRLVYVRPSRSSTSVAKH
mgnify:CR=1 FL=1